MIGIAATVVAGAAAAGGLVVARSRQRTARRVERLRAEGQERAASARSHVEKARGQALERAEQLRARMETDLVELEASLAEDAVRLERLTGTVDRRAEQQEARDAEIGERYEQMKTHRRDVKALRKELDALTVRIAESTEAAAGTSRDALVDEITNELQGGARRAAQRAARALTERIEMRAELEARRLIDVASQRYGTALPADRLVGRVDLPRSKKLSEALQADEFAVLQAITEETEVEFIPQGDGRLFLQAPDPYTREIARLAFVRLVGGGNINEQLARKRARSSARDLEKTVRKAGREAARILGLKGVHPEILHLVGKLLYRTSYTQNQWQHAIETAHLCGLMAAELDMDVNIAHRSALMHDIGKVLWAETEAVGSHAVSGAAFAADHGEVPEIVHPIAAHHADEKPSSPLAHLVAAADALSGARPGARRETIEAYTERVDDLERICGEFKGVRKSFVLSGGREVRIQVDPQRVDDLGAMQLSADVAARIEDEMVYPGQIKVTVMREVKTSATSR